MLSQVKSTYSERSIRSLSETNSESKLPKRKREKREEEVHLLVLLEDGDQGAAACKKSLTRATEEKRSLIICRYRFLYLYILGLGE